MNFFIKKGFLFLLAIFSISFHSANCQNDLVKGITVISSPDSTTSYTFEKLKNIGANWICIVPYRNVNPITFAIDAEYDFNWWGLSESGIRNSIRLAKKEELEVMLKPQLYLEKSWPGIIDFKDTQSWERWEKEYEHFIFKFLEIAISEKVDIFCIGTELKVSIDKRPKFWNTLIKRIKSTYSGKLIYSANWDAYDQIPFWNELDYIGISCYFPLSKKDQPTIHELKKKWKPIVNQLNRYAYKKGKKILFTEYGYLSVDGASSEHWLLEERIEELNANQNAQNVALEALYKTWWNEKIWAGGFLWKWYPEMKGHQGNLNKDYSPQNKVALTTIKKWFKK